MENDADIFEALGWIDALRAVEVDDLASLAELTRRVPDRLLLAIGERGGPMIRERLIAPVMAEAERAGLVEWTGKRDMSGQKIWRNLIKPKPSFEPTSGAK